MKVAIVGPPKSGKSTVFAAVTGQQVDPYAAPEPHHAMVSVPDPRLKFLAGLCNPKRVTEAAIEFIDFPGFSLDDAHGQEELRRLLPEVRQAELLAVVVRNFQNAAVPAYRNRIDPKADLAEVWSELIFADLDTVTSRLERLDKALKKPTRHHEAEKRELALLERCREALESEKPLSTAIATTDEEKMVRSFAFLTQKPMVCLHNVSDDKAGATLPVEEGHVIDTVTLCASIEAELAAFEPDERRAFMEEMGIEETARERLIRTCYRACGLISFLTMGPEEVRAWTIDAGMTAVDAAGRIHTDLARGFIRAETIGFDELVECGDMRTAKAAGKVRKEGKAYVVKDGDVILILASA